MKVRKTISATILIFSIILTLAFTQGTPALAANTGCPLWHSSLPNAYLFPPRLTSLNAYVHKVWLGTQNLGNGNDWEEMSLTSAGQNTLSFTYPRGQYRYIAISYATKFTYVSDHFMNGSQVTNPSYLSRQEYYTNYNVTPLGGTGTTHKAVIVIIPLPAVGSHTYRLKSHSGVNVENYYVNFTLT